jgi:hypothetical protein
MMEKRDRAVVVAGAIVVAVLFAVVGVAAFELLRPAPAPSPLPQGLALVYDAQAQALTCAFDREAAQPSCDVPSCTRSLSETCQVYAPIPIFNPLAPGPKLGHCATGSVQVQGRQCSCRCASLTGEINVTISCSDRWLVRTS